MRFAISGALDVIAPGLIEQTWNEAEVMGSAVWLWMHSQSLREMPLHTLSSLLLPAIKHRQFILASEGGRPVFYLSWANLSLDAENRYLRQHRICMPESDWNSGDRMWILEWVAPFGHTRVMTRLLEQQLFASRCARSLYHRGDERGARVMTFRGAAMLHEEARTWFQSHPVAFPAAGNSTLLNKEII